MTSLLLSLTIIFSQLSLLAFGGGNTILPEIHRQVVDVHHWITAENFAALFALAQAAPGPNLMIVPLLGWHIAGWAGLLVTSFAKFAPSSLVTILVIRVWDRFQAKPWRVFIQQGIFPMTVGFVAASAVLITAASVHNGWFAGMTALSAWLGWRTRVHPLWILMAGGVFGLVASTSVS